MTDPIAHPAAQRGTFSGRAAEIAMGVLGVPLGVAVLVAGASLAGWAVQPLEDVVPNAKAADVMPLVHRVELLSAIVMFTAMGWASSRAGRFRPLLFTADALVGVWLLSMIVRL